MYSELCEKLFEQNANNYIALFNEIDKFLDTVSDSEKFMPFNEKVKYIAQWDSPLAVFLRKYEGKLKYFGELRNHIAHGFKLEGKHYAIPSYHALDELRKIADAVMKPVTCRELCAKQVYVCSTQDTVAEVVTMMRNFGYTHVPVKNDANQIIGMLTSSTIAEWIEARVAVHEMERVENALIGEVDLTLGTDTYVCISAMTPVYSVPMLFEQKELNKKRIGALYMTQDGTMQQELLGVITPYDLPELMQHIPVSM